MSLVKGTLMGVLLNFCRRRSSYTEMFIQDPENDEEIALADYGDTHADIDTNF